MAKDNFTDIDLNLLLVFSVLMREGSATSTAKRLYISQSAVSQRLRRLRSIMNDPLFLRSRSGVTPTPRAEALYRSILPSLQAIEEAMRNQYKFDPKRSHQHFKVRLISSHSVSLAPELLRRIQKQAPMISVSFAVGGENGNLIDSLNCGSFDLVVTSDVSPKPSYVWLSHLDLPGQELACIYDGKRLEIGSPIGIDDYVDMPHAIPFLSPDQHNTIDAALAAVGKARKHAIMTDDYAGIPYYLKKTRALANLPLGVARVFAKNCDLVLSPIPIPVPLYPTSLFWHKKNNDNPGHMWLRDLVFDIFNRSARID